MWRFFPWIVIPLAAVAAGAARRAAWEARAERRAWRREHRRHSFAGVLWGAFWISVALAFVFGGHETRRAMIGAVASAWWAVRDFFSGLAGAGVQ